jgi:hypothetical protein
MKSCSNFIRMYLHQVNVLLHRLFEAAQQKSCAGNMTTLYGSPKGYINVELYSNYTGTHTSENNKLSSNSLNEIYFLHSDCTSVFTFPGPLLISILFINVVIYINTLLWCREHLLERQEGG